MIMNGRRIRPIPGFENKYAVSDRGEVINVRGDYQLNGYRGIYVNLGKKKFRIDYLVARAFVPNIRMCQRIIHKDGDQTNNRADNLEWTDLSHRDRTNLYNPDGVCATFGKPKVAVNCMDEDYRIIKTYPSVNSAAKALGLSQPNISRAMRNGMKCGGYRWSMVLEGDEVIK